MLNPRACKLISRLRPFLELRLESNLDSFTRKIASQAVDLSKNFRCAGPRIACDKSGVTAFSSLVGWLSGFVLTHYYYFTAPCGQLDATFLPLQCRTFTCLKFSLGLM